jgi:putative acetyltransferase
MGEAEGFRIIAGDLDDDRVVALLEIHLASARAETAPGSAHALDLDALRGSEIGFWTIWRDGALLGTGALKRLSPDHGEIKSMHVAAAARRSGVGAAMLRHLLEAAAARGLTRVSLETGSWDYFRPARSLYARHGFAECPPFGDYRPDLNSIFMTRDLVRDG